MGRLDNFEDRIERAMDNAAGAMFKSPLNPVQITKRAEKEMNREKLVSAGKQYAPTLYNILVNSEDDKKLAGFYPTLGGELETYLKSKAKQSGLSMDGSPLVRFIVDSGLKRGKFDVIAENVAAPIIAQLREEEMQRYGIANAGAYTPRTGHSAARAGAAAGFAGGVAAGAAPRGYAEPFDDDFQDWDEPYQETPADDYPPVPHTSSFAGSASLSDIRTGETYELNGLRLSIGREKNNNIVIRDANASRTHAEFVQEGGFWTLRDLGSTNGTLVNDQEISQCSLYDGDIITIGMTNLEFREG